MKRIDILKQAAEPILDNDGGYVSFICPALTTAILDSISVNISVSDISKVYRNISENLNKIFPAFNREIAIKHFNGTTPRSGEVWFNNNDDRIRFMKYLLDIYKDDTIEIEDILKEFNIYEEKHYETCCTNFSSST